MAALGGTDGAGDDVSGRLAELLKHPDDLDKVAMLKAEFARKKAGIDGQLKHNLGEQLALTQSGMTNIGDAQKTVQVIREEMMKIDKLCAEAQGMIRDFPEINRLSLMQRNFAAVDTMKEAIENFAIKLADTEDLLREDDEDLENLPNLLAVHETLSTLRDMRTDAMEQIKGNTQPGLNGASLEGDTESLELLENLPLADGQTLRDHFAKLDDLVDSFDEHLGQACINIIPLVQSGNNSIVVRLALVIEEEEKEDRKVKALQRAQRDFGDIAANLQNVNVSHRELRGYKKKFYQAVEASAAAQFETVKQAFLDDPDRIEKACRWFFNDLNTVKLGMQQLVPNKWRIFQSYVKIYHKLMHDFLVERLDSDDSTPVHLLAILNWVSKYHSKMSRLGANDEDLTPPLIDERETELVRDYRNLIVKAVEDWMERLARNDKQAFTTRAEGSLDQDADHHLHTKSSSDMWTMLKEQLAAAQGWGRPDVVEGVVEAMMRALKGRQQMWERLLDDEARKVEATTDLATLEGVSSLQEWLAAIANDQIRNIDDNDGTSYLTRFKDEYSQAVTPVYLTGAAAAEHEALTIGYVDLATHCMAVFARVIFATDFRDAVKEFFTANGWHGKRTMAQIIMTFEDYLTGESNYTEVLHPSLRDIFVEELGDALLVSYLSAVRNKGVKFRRSDMYPEKIREDIQEVFKFFSAHEEVFPIVKEKWRAVMLFEKMLSADKGQGVVAAFEEFRMAYWDVHMGWIEAVLRARDDFERSMWSAVKKRAAEMELQRGPETVMAKVK